MPVPGGAYRLPHDPLACCLLRPHKTVRLSLLEAQAAELPVVADHRLRPAWVLDNQATDLLTAPSNTEAFASAIRALLNEPASRWEMGTAARRKLLTEHSMERAAAEIAKTLQSLPARHVS